MRFTTYYKSCFGGKLIDLESLERWALLNDFRETNDKLIVFREIGWFNGISTLVGYLTPTPVNTYIRYVICKQIVGG